jgi:hypothetical protein
MLKRGKEGQDTRQMKVGRNLNIYFVFAAVVFAAIAGFSQQITEESVVINVEVPVRVFQGRTFVETLGLNDFEVFQDGIPQRIEAVYLIKKRNVERSEERKRFIPKTARNFYLYFEISEYTPKIGEAIEYFIHDVMYPDDFLIVITPLKTYKLHGRALKLKPRNQVIEQLKRLVKKDTLIGTSEYRRTLTELEVLVRSVSKSVIPEEPKEQPDDLSLTGISELPIEQQLNLYRRTLNNLEKLRSVNQQKLLDLADVLKNHEGQKHVFMFYQREYLPQIDQRVMNSLISHYQDRPTIKLDVAQIFEFYRRDLTIDTEGIKQAFANSSISIHFLFIAQPRKHSPGIQFRDKSEDIYAVFKEMSRATGGFFDSSANPQYLFEKAVESSENYYLLYYSPKNYKGDGKFKRIKVRVKSGDYRISHRLGYFAN